jgi:hypothetical protein
MKVGCVGDSIKKLGSGYTAKTFGVSMTTLLKNVGQELVRERRPDGGAAHASRARTS